MKQKKTILLFFLLLCYSLPGYAQKPREVVQTPGYVLKTNLLGDLATTINLAGEIKLDIQTSLGISVMYNPWSFSEEKKMKHFLVQPEVRYWFCETFNGAFAGVHVHYGLFNIGGIGFNDYMKQHRHEGWLTGAGLSVGYHWILTPRLSLEANLGAGYAYLDYGVYPCEKCGEKLGDKTMHYIGPTQLALSLVYILK